MRVKCDYCGNMINETAEKCENCGAPNEKLKRVGNGVPQTIDELKIWYTEHNLPEPEITRFFIGIDYKKPKAFGIYKKDDGNFVVYKNKDNGSRAIRYEGTDEGYAVNEIYLKLKEEIQNQKSNNNNNSKKTKTNKIISSIIIWYLISFLVPFILVPLVFAFTTIINKDNGYYNYDGTEYYKHASSWYVYNNDRWQEIDKSEISSDFTNNYSNYYEGSSYSSTSFDGEDIEDTSIADSWHSSDSSSSDWDSSSSWDSSDSWDSGGTDWSSDW